MTDEDVIVMARKAGAVFPADGSYHSFEIAGTLQAFAELVAAKERARIVELVDQYDGWIARQISEEPEDPLPDVDRNAMLQSLMPEIEKLFNVAYKERT